MSASWRIALAATLAIAVSASAAEGQDPRFAHALELFSAGQYSESAQLLAELAGREPRRALYWFNLANARYRLGSFEAAEAGYDKVIQLQSPLADAAAFYKAQCETKLGHPAQATRLLKQLRERALPPHLSQAVRLALADLEPGGSNSAALDAAMRAYSAKDYAHALRALDSVILTSPSADAHFLRGLTLLRLNDPQGARQAFEQVIALGAADPGLQRDARDFVRQIRDGVWSLDKPLALSADIWLDYNSNVFDDGVSGSPVAEPVVHAAAALRYRLLANDSLAAVLLYRPQWDEIVSYPDERLVSNYARVQFSRTTGPWFFSVSPDLNHEILGTSAYLLATGVQLRVERSFNPHLLGVTLDLHRNWGLQDIYSYLSGNVLNSRAYWSYLTPRAEYWAFLSFNREAIGDESINGGILPLANHSLGGGAGVTAYPTPLTELTLSAAYFHVDYDNPSQPTGTLRGDDLWSATAILGWWPTPRLRPFASVSLNWNNSTLDSSAVEDMNYRQWVASLGLSWSILP